MASPRTPWRTFALLTLAVALAHLLLLALAPAGMSADPLPLVNRFSTRTIVITPPAAAAAAKAVEAAPPLPQSAAAAPVRPRPAGPRFFKPNTAPAHVPPAQSAINSIAEEIPLTVREAAAEAPAAEAPAAAPPSAGAAADASPENGNGSSASASPGSGTGTAGAGAGAGAGDGASVGAGAPTAGATRPLRVPGSVRLTFEVTAQQGPQPLSGAFGELIWLQDGTRYNARLSMKLLFKTLRQWTSTGAIGADGIEPERYSDTRRSEVASHFVRERGEIVFSTNAPRVPLQAGAQDRLSVMMQLGALLAGDAARYPAGSQIALQTVTARDADVWVFNVGEEETLSLPAGEIVARKLTRPPRREFDLKVELWLAPAHAWLPARLVLTEPNGDFADFQVRDFLSPSPAN